MLKIFFSFPFGSLLSTSKNQYNVNFVGPTFGNEYNFGGMSISGLVEAFEKRMIIAPIEFEKLSLLWRAYQEDRFEDMTGIAESLSKKYPFLLPAIKAHIDRFPKVGNPGRIQQTLLEIVKDLGNTDFNAVFNEFIRREPIYGFGDLQVKRIFRKIQI